MLVHDNLCRPDRTLPVPVFAEMRFLPAHRFQNPCRPPKRPAPSLHFLHHGHVHSCRLSQRYLLPKRTLPQIHPGTCRKYRRPVPPHFARKADILLLEGLDVLHDFRIIPGQSPAGAVRYALQPKTALAPEKLVFAAASQRYPGHCVQLPAPQLGLEFLPVWSEPLSPFRL